MTVIHKDSNTFDVVLKVYVDAKGLSAHFSLCDDRILEEDRDGAVNSGALLLDQAMRVTSVSGAGQTPSLAFCFLNSTYIFSQKIL